MIEILRRLYRYVIRIFKCSFFFQAEDGIRDIGVTGVQTCALPIYTCGPTVYRYAHIGNLRTFLLSDLVRRGLEFEGYRVTQIINITDVGHMVDESSDAGRDRMELAVDDEIGRAHV